MPNNSFNYLLKRPFDIVFSLFCIMVTLPISALIILAIELERWGPVLFSSERVGKDNKLFELLQFRSMKYSEKINGAYVQIKENDVRLTRTGEILRATALDTIPQLLNIFKGEMSFVGPRPLLPQEIDENGKIIKVLSQVQGFKERIKVLPGLTGISQVLLPRDTSLENKFRYDIWYIENSSFILDLKIILLSILISINSRWESKMTKLGYLNNFICSPPTQDLNHN